MKNIIRITLTGIMLILIVLGCKRDELDLDKISKKFVVERDVAMPLIRGSFNFGEMIEESEDSILVINGDTVKMVIQADSLFNLNVRDYIDIPPQNPLTYVISPPADIFLPPLLTGDTSLASLISDTIFVFNLLNSMRLDSVMASTGDINVSADNSFNHDIKLVISSSSITDEFNNRIIDTLNVPAGSSNSMTINIDNHRIKTIDGYYDTTGQTAISVRFDPIITRNIAENFIRASESLDIHFGLGDINDFEAAFGFFGFDTISFDTTVNDIFPEMLEGVDGTFSVTNPKLRLNYEQSLGISLNMDFLMEAMHTDQPDVTIDPAKSVINYSNDYNSPIYSGSIVWDRTTVLNIDQLISFPLPDSIMVSAAFILNEGADSLTSVNYILNDSKFDLSLEFEVPLEFRADLTYLDTIKLGEIIDSADFVEVEFVNLHYWFENYFPVGYDANLILYDTVSVPPRTLDTIKLNTVPGTIFMEPAPVDANGSVVRDQVERQAGVVVLTKSAAQNLLNVATHLIMEAKLMSTDFNSVRISTESGIEYQFGIEAKGSYHGSLESK